MKTKIAYWACQIGGWGVYSAVGMAMGAQAVGYRFSLVAGFALFFLYSIALTDLLRREIRRRGWLISPSGKTWARLMLAAAVVGTIQSFLVVSLNLALRGSTGTFSRPDYLVQLWLSICSATALWTIFYVAFTARRRFQEKAVRLELALREAELRALVAQINPHFLFNCLNSIRALVIENPAMAQDMLTRLANILRYNLHRDLTHTVPLASEVEVVADYLALESVRFEERLRVELAIDPAANGVPIPPMLLQTLVENALKHGIAHLPAGGDLLIRVTAAPEGTIVEVENTGQLVEARSDATMVGLANVRERLRILYGERASLQLKNHGSDRVAATVLIPKIV